MNSVGKWTPLPHESPRVASNFKKQKRDRTAKPHGWGFCFIKPVV